MNRLNASESIILEQLQGPLNDMLVEIYRDIFLKKMAKTALNYLIPDEGVVTLTWKWLDNPILWNNIMSHKSGIIRDLENGVFHSLRDDLNSSIVRAGLSKLSNKKMNLYINNAISNQYLISSLSKGVTDPFPETWSRLGDLIATYVAIEYSSHSSLDEWRLLNRLLLSSFFKASRIPSAFEMQKNLEQLRSPLSGLPGSLVRIPSRIWAGILDKEPEVISWRGPTAGLYRNWTELQEQLHCEISLYNKSHGPMSRFLLDSKRSVPSDYDKKINLFQMDEIRKERYREYDRALLSYMAATSLEQLLRGWADYNGITHTEGTGNSLPWSSWGKNLKNNKYPSPCSLHLYENIDAYYSAVRNRVMHGGLLEISSKRREVTLAAARKVGMLVCDICLDNDPFSIDNNLWLGLDLIEKSEIEMRLSGVLLTSSHSLWIEQLILTDSELKEGIALGKSNADYSKFLPLLYATFPVFKHLFELGLQGWTEDAISSNSYSKHLMLGLVFEGIYRSVVLLLGESVLQYPIASSETSEMHISYKMLNKTHLYSPDIISNFIKYINNNEINTFERVLELSLKSRNAISHGAIGSFSELRRKGEGSLLIKCIFFLLEIIHKHMISKASYYKSKIRINNNEDGDHVSDWIFAEKQIELMIKNPINI